MELSRVALTPTPQIATTAAWEAHAAATMAPEQLVEALVVAFALQQAEESALLTSGATAPSEQQASTATTDITSAAPAPSEAAGAGTSRARQVGSELWAGVRDPRSAHVSQVPSKYNPRPAAGNRDCGPVSVVVALNLLGRGVKGSSAQSKVNTIRALAGAPDNRESTTNLQLERALQTSGARTTEIRDYASIRAAVTSGQPVILNGNPRHAGAYGTSFKADEMTPYDGPHWITVSGIDRSSGKFIINDPLSKIGPVKVTPKQLEAYRGGSLGIAVAA